MEPSGGGVVGVEVLTLTVAVVTVRQLEARPHSRSRDPMEPYDGRSGGVEVLTLTVAVLSVGKLQAHPHWRSRDPNPPGTI